MTASTRRATALAGVALAGALALAPAASATAAPATASASAAARPSGTGWVRVAHLSPDTRHVDVTLAALSGGAVKYRLDDVGYGAVSRYMSLDDGTYTVSMTPTGARAGTPAVVQATVRVASRSASTVAVFGRNGALRARVVPDDLTTPKAGTARVRLVQASTEHRTVDVKTSTGIVIASKAQAASATGYAAVPARPWKLVTTAGGTTTTSTVRLTNGEVASLFVLDTASGGTVVRPVVDAASVGRTPKGFLATGGGYLVRQAAAEQQGLGTAGVLGLAIAVVAGTAVVLRRRMRAVGADRA